MANGTTFSKQQMEVVYDISFTAGHMLAKGEISLVDSRELYTMIIEWAEEFCQNENASWESDDYTGAVEQFALMKLSGAYGVQEEAECDWCEERHAENKCVVCGFTACSRCFSGKTCPNCYAKQN